MKVITNPHALVVHNEEPGKVVLLGAEAGEWTVSVKMADGSKINYDVTVKSVGSAFNINHPGTSAGGNRWAPARASGSAAPVVAKMDAGQGRLLLHRRHRRLLRRHPAELTTTTDTVARGRGLIACTAPAPAAATLLRRVLVSRLSFDFSPSVPAASYESSTRRRRARPLRQHCRASAIEPTRR